MNLFRVSVLLLIMMPRLLEAQKWSECQPKNRRLIVENKRGEEHGGSSERKLIVPKGALYNMYFSIAKKDPAEDAYPHIWALFEPVNKTYDYFTFASCFTNTSSWGELIPLSDDPELNDVLFVDPAATPPTLDYRQLHPMGNNIIIDDIAAAVESSSAMILEPYDVVLHNCAYRLVELAHKLGKMPSGQQQRAERDALIQYFTERLEGFGFGSLLRNNSEALKTLYSFGADDQAMSTVADLSDYTLMKHLVVFTIEAQEKCGDGIVDLGEDCDLGSAQNGMPGSPCSLFCGVSDWYCPKPYFSVVDEAHKCERNQNAAKTWYGPPLTDAVNSYDQAVAFCKDRNLVLGSLNDYCDERLQVFEGARVGHHWSPTSDYYNAWVFVGDRDFQGLEGTMWPVCRLHEDTKSVGVDAGWGRDATTKESWEASHILCREPVKNYYGPDGTAHIKSYDQAKAWCEDQGLTLGSYEDYCDSSNIPIDGIKEGHQWLPTSDHRNAWIFLGNDGYYPPCTKHEDFFGENPAWGLDEISKEAYNGEIFEANYVLCLPKETVLYGPTLTDFIEGHDEASYFCKIKNRTLGTFDEYCSEEGTVRLEGWNPTADIWAPIADERNAWVYIGNDAAHVCSIHDSNGGVLAVAPPSVGTLKADFVICTATQASSFVPVQSVLENECKKRRGEYKGPSSDDPVDTCNFSPCPWASGFVMVDATHCITEEMPGCNSTCARNKCENFPPDQGHFLDLQQSYFGDGRNNFLCSKSPPCSYINTVGSEHIYEMSIQKSDEMFDVCVAKDTPSCDFACIDELCVENGGIFEGTKFPTMVARCKFAK